MFSEKIHFSFRLQDLTVYKIDCASSQNLNHNCPTSNHLGTSTWNEGF